MTIALSWVVPCASTWGVVGLVSGTFFGNGAVVVVLSLFIVALLHIFITYKVFGRSLNKVEERTGLIMELPPYHKESPLGGQRRSIRQTDTFLFVPSHTAGAP